MQASKLLGCATNMFSTFQQRKTQKMNKKKRYAAQGVAVNLICNMAYRIATNEHIREYKKKTIDYSLYPNADDNMVYNN